MVELTTEYEHCQGCGGIQEVAVFRNDLGGLKICSSCVAEAAMMIGKLEQPILEFDILAESRVCQ